MEIVQSILKENIYYKAARKITVKGLMLHSVACPQPNAQVFIKAWNNKNYLDSCVHGIIDGNTGKVYQTLPWNHRGIHAGGSANNTHIGIEMGEPAEIQYLSDYVTVRVLDEEKAKATVARTYASAVELFAMLADKYHLDPLAEGVIISHAEGAALGVANDHADPTHLWNQLGTGYTMDGFRRDVALAMGKITQQESFIVRVAIPNLNIRKGPGTNYGVTGRYTGKGAFTIVEVAEGEGSDTGWGLLKAYASKRNGWISLDYCTTL